MFQQNYYFAQETLFENNISAKTAQRAISDSIMLYRAAEWKGLIGKILARLTGRSRRLLDLNQFQRQTVITGRSYAGIQTVPVRKIQGSEGRTNDFDREFYPLHSRSKSRWMSVARAVLMHQSLPPVELIQIGEVYFVRDGHHRISVAHASGQEQIEAEVTVWHTSDPITESGPGCVAGMAVQAC